MKSRKGRDRAAMGFTVKSGWAAVVLLGEPPGSPRVLATCRLDLSDPTIPEARQPYHDGFGTARRSGPELSCLVAAVQRFGRQAVTGLVRQYRADGHDLVGVGVAVGSLTDPDTIANVHIRIHALEGQLFRNVVEDAAARAGLASSTWRGRDLYGRAVEILKRTEPQLRSVLSAVPRPVPRPWRAEQKAAALAAWLVLASRMIVAARKVASQSRASAVG